MKDLSPRGGSLSYAIEVEGVIDARWSEWFGDLEVTLAPSPASSHRTTLIARLPDQAALPTLLARVMGLNLKVVSVTPEATPNSTRRRTEAD